MFILLFIIYLIIFILGLNLFKTRLNPITAFTGGFLACIFFCLANYSKWEMESFHFNTFCIMCFGGITFVLGCLWVQLKFRWRMQPNTDNLYRVFEVKNIYILIYLVYVIVIIWYSFNYLINVTGADNISQAAFINYHSGFVEGDNSQFQLPLLPRLLKSIVVYLNYYFLFILANKLVHKEPLKNELLLIAICFVSSFAGLTSGSRGSLFEPLLYFLCVYVCLKCKNSKRKNHIKLKKLLLGLFGVLFFLYLFFMSGSLFGRDTGDEDIIDYMSAYVGAQPKNLDLFMNEYHKPNMHPGAYTFSGIFSNFIEIKPVYEMSMPRWVNGYSLGNVYTGFSTYFYDFGVVGTIIFLFFIGIFFQVLYVKSLRSTGLRKRYFIFSIFFYAYFLQGLILNFFGERVCRLFSPLTLKCIIVIYIFDVVIRHITGCRLSENRIK